jgi:Cation transporting ATPase, C-terminus
VKTHFQHTYATDRLPGRIGRSADWASRLGRRYFASIVAAVEEGHGVFANIKKYLMYLPAANLGEIGLLAGTSLLGKPLPLSAVQILYVNLATDGLPAIALSVTRPRATSCAGPRAAAAPASSPARSSPSSSSPTSRGACKYSGTEIARLFGPGGRVAANIGGRPPDSFGAVVRDTQGHGLLVSQRERTSFGHLRILESPRGAYRHARPYALPPYAGPFRRLVALGTTASRSIRVSSRYSFHAESIDVDWRVSCHGCAGRTVDVLLPT